MSEPQPPAQPTGTPVPPPAGHRQPGPPPFPATPPASSVAGTQAPYDQAPASGASALSGTNPLGRVAFILALAVLAIGVFISLSFPVLLRGWDLTMVGVVSGIGNGLVLLVAIAALILGLISVRRAGPPVLAGIAIGISASAIVGILFSWLSGLTFALIY